MIKLFIKAFLSISLFFCYSTPVLAEEIIFTITSNTSDEQEEMVVVYSSNGYQGKINDQNISMETTENLTTLTFGKTVVTIIAKGGYWHTNLGVQKSYPVITSSGSIGFHKLTYLGKNNKNYKIYHEEVWLEGFLRFTVQSLLDAENKLLWSITLGKDTATQIERK